MGRDYLGGFEHSVLLAVHRLGNDAYGLAVRDALEEHAGRRYSIGAAYATLERLKQKGFLVSQDRDPLPSRGGRARRFYSITASGYLALKEAETAMAGLRRGLRLAEA